MLARIATVCILLLLSQPAWAAETTVALTVAGVARSYLLHLPPGAPGHGALPLVLMLHGGGGNGTLAAQQTGFDAAADRGDFVVAYPNGSDKVRPLLNALGKPAFLTWNAGGCCGYAQRHGIDDVGFLRAVIADIARRYPIDRRRIYIAGHSNGAMMAYRFACEASDLVAAVGIVSGVIVTAPCAPAQPVSVIDIHGTADENVPIAGGVGPRSITRVNYPPVQRSIDFWVGQDRCAAPKASTPFAGVTLADYAPCATGTEVAYYAIEGGTHSWPGGGRVSLLLDKPSQALDATALIWGFFQAHPK